MSEELTKEVLLERIKNAKEAAFRSCSCEKGCDELLCPIYRIQCALRGEPTNKCWICDEPIPGYFDEDYCGRCLECAREDNVPVCPDCNAAGWHLRIDDVADPKTYFECPVCQQLLERPESRNE